jgi:hypothetical protein
MDFRICVFGAAHQDRDREYQSLMLQIRSRFRQHGGRDRDHDPAAT